MMRYTLRIAVAAALAFCLTGCSIVLPSGAGSSGTSSADSSSSIDLRDDVEYEAGGANGYVGDILHTAFLNFAVTDAYTCASYGDFTPQEGNQILVVEVAILNTSTASLPMFDTDFQIQWGDGREDYGWPITTAEEVWDHQTRSEEALDERQLPGEYEIAINAQRSGLLFFEVPAGGKDYALSFEEYFEDGTVGDVYFVYFTAEEGPASAE